MQRLLEWDVWIGKTAVAFVAGVHVILEAKIQVAIMAPTEILARQHFDWMQNFLLNFWNELDLLVWSLTEKQKKEAKQKTKKWNNPNSDLNTCFGSRRCLFRKFRFCCSWWAA